MEQINSGQELFDLMTPEQQQMLEQPLAMREVNRLHFPLGTDPFAMTGHFHQVTRMPTPEWPIKPSVSHRERRLRLVLEEFLELVEAMGFTLEIDGVRFDQGHETIGVRHIEGSRYDIVETLDALADINVVVNGTAVEFGLPMHFANHEVYCSNLTKLDEFGLPIVNHCQVCGLNEDDPYLSECDPTRHQEPHRAKESWLKPDAPIGKLLKPEGFVKANIPGILEGYYNKEL